MNGKHHKLLDDIIDLADRRVNKAKAQAFDLMMGQLRRLSLAVETEREGGTVPVVIGKPRVPLAPNQWREGVGKALEKLEAWEHAGMPVGEPEAPTETVEDPQPEPAPTPEPTTEPTPEPKTRRRRPRGRAVSQVKPAGPKEPEAKPTPEPATLPDVRPADGEGLEPLGTVEPSDDGTLAGLFPDIGDQD